MGEVSPPIPDWGQVKPLLDDPDVSDGAKKDLALAYAARDNSSLFGAEDEVVPYLDKYDDGYWAVQGENLVASNTGGRYENLNEQFQNADREATRNAPANGNDALRRSRSAGQHGQHGGAGVAKSDELLDVGESGLRFFRMFIPVYREIRYDTTDPSLVPQASEIEERYREQAGIDFAKFGTEISELRAAEGALRKAHGDMGGRLDGLWQGWTGAAADSAHDFFSNTFTPTARERVITRVADSAGALEETVRAVAEICRGKAEFALGIASKPGCTIAGKHPYEWQPTVEVANGADDDETLRKVCAIWGVPIEESCWDGELTDDDEPGRMRAKGSKQQVIDKARTVVRRSLAQTVEQQCAEFLRRCDDAKSKVDEAWKALNEELGKAEENPFAHPAADRPGAAQSDLGRSGGGSAAAGSAAASAPTAASDEAATPAPRMSQPGTPPDQMPPSPPAQVPPSEPPPPGAMPANPAPERVTLGQGAGAVTVGRPDPQGHVAVGLTGADGRPRNFDVALGGAQPAAPADGVVPIAAGPDGAAVIHDGDRSISVAPGPDGALRVGVDGGHGQPPLEQTIGFGQPAPEPARSTPAGPTADQSSRGPGAIPPGQPHIPVSGPVRAGSAPAMSGELFPPGAPDATGPVRSADAHEGGPQGETGSASAAEPPPAPAPASGQDSGSNAAGGGMMGGMGGMGAMRGGDQVRSNSSPWRTEGQLFDDGVEDSRVRFRATLGDEEGT